MQKKRVRRRKKDDAIPELADLSTSEDESSESSDEDSSESYLSDDDDALLHGVCGEPPVGADVDNSCLIGKYIVKEFLPRVGDEKQLYTAVITAYDQKSQKFTVCYHSDKLEEKLTRATTVELHEKFEWWYAKVSQRGQRFTRQQALPVVIGAYDREKIVSNAKKANPVDLTADDTAVATNGQKVQRDIERGISISRMKVQQLRDELRELDLNQTGYKLDLQQRLCKHYKCTLPAKAQKVSGKHAATWKPTVLPVERSTFTDTAFNRESLAENLPGFADGQMPEPWQCHNFFFTDSMWELGAARASAYPKTLAAQTTRPPWVAKNLMWPPAWTSKARIYDVNTYQHMTMILHLMGLKHCGNQRLRQMFGNDELYTESWLKDRCSRLEFESFLRQVHFEDAIDPFGKRFSHSINYRPNNVPKVGLLMELFRQRCVLFRPEHNMSFDEATAKYGGRMTHLKHLQSKYKPYDGIRIYSLNGSKSGYTQNFRVDLRDGTTTATMLRGCCNPFNKLGYTIWGDNAFVSVEMLKYFRENGTNFAGTTRTTYGFPQSLAANEDTLAMGEWKWLMAAPGLLAAYWCDVGYVKLMSNFHTPKQGMVLRKVKGQADREERGAPLVGQEYNDFMGGTDKKDFMRGLFTVCRRSKKWWKSLWYWVLDASMYNVFVLHKWCLKALHPRLKYKITYARFIRLVTDHFLKAPSQRRFSTPRCASRRRVPMLNLTPEGTVTTATVVTTVASSPGMYTHSPY